jgi:glycine reductase
MTKNRLMLELANFPVKEVEFGNRTRYENGLLEICKEEMVSLILEDPRVSFADIDIAFPGEQTRIVNVRDAVEPRIKVSGPGSVFPGILGPVETVGSGTTHRMSGITVMPSADFRPTILNGTAAPSAGIVDMWGTGGQLTPFGSLINIVPKFELRDGINELEAHTAIQAVELKVALRLAQTTLQKKPVEAEILELAETDPTLPRVVYIMTCLTHRYHPYYHSGVAYYGLPIRESLPTLIHPNELFDGALTTNTYAGGGMWETTWVWMTQPVALELLRKHGKELNFLGVILQRTRFENKFTKQVTAECASQMATLLGADGAIITRIVTSGANFIDVMLTVQACEKKGIKTVLLTPEWGGKDGTDLPLVFYVPEATAMVSTGSFERDVKVGAPAKVIGAGKREQVQVYADDRPFSPWDELTLPSSFLITGGVDWFGHMNLTCR